MKILISCPRCTDPENNAAVLEIDNNNIYTVKCDYNHEQNILIPLQKHEFLFEIGAHAIVDGYYREAISSFAASLERYYEFFIRVISFELQQDTIDTAWKRVSSQSERQLGGYIFSYLLTYGEAPNLLDDKLINLRNKVIHKGYIPNKDEVIGFGDAIAKLINTGCNTLHQQQEYKIRGVLLSQYSEDSRSDRIHLPHTYLNSLTENDLEGLKSHLSSVQTHNMRRF